ncbi:MAG: hypothetical protein WC373_11485 [Smithella sp.]|jgi:hypothetical protein
MAVKSLSISDELLEKITREAKQKNLSFSELVCQRISQSYVPVSSQKCDHGAEKILAKIDSLDTNFKQTFNALKKQNPQIDLENQLNDWLNILERRIKDKISVLGSSIENQNQLFKDLYPKIKYKNSYDWGDTLVYIADHFMSYSWIHSGNILLLLLLIFLGVIIFLNTKDWDWTSKALLVLAVIPAYYFLLHRILKCLIVRGGWHQKE